jgi:hypothetical protein
LRLLFLSLQQVIRNLATVALVDLQRITLLVMVMTPIPCSDGGRPRSVTEVKGYNQAFTGKPQVGKDGKPVHTRPHKL